MKHFENFSYKSDVVTKFKEIYGKEEEFKEIPLSFITVLTQVRTEFDEDKINELAESIKKMGVIQPVVVVANDEGYRLVIGERRFRGSKLAGRDTIPARIFKNLSEEEIMVLQLMENIHREDLKPMELAGVYKKFKDEGMSTRDIAEMVKKSQPHVVETLKLLRLADDLKEKVISGLSPSKADEISKLDEKIQKEVLKNSEKYSRDALRNLRKTKDQNQKPVLQENLNTQDHELNGVEPENEIQEPEDRELIEEITKSVELFNESHVSIKISQLVQISPKGYHMGITVRNINSAKQIIRLINKLEEL